MISLILTLFAAILTALTIACLALGYFEWRFQRELKREIETRRYE